MIKARVGELSAFSYQLSAIGLRKRDVDNSGYANCLQDYENLAGDSKTVWLKADG
jgi:hypothetical protein